MTNRDDPPPSGRSRGRAPKRGDSVPIAAYVAPWVRDVIGEAAEGPGIAANADRLTDSPARSGT